MKPLPPINETPRNCNELVFPILEYEVLSWTPERDGKGKCTQVHIILKGRGIESPFVLRIKSKDAANQFIAALERHRDDVWGKE